MGTTADDARARLRATHLAVLRALERALVPLGGTPQQAEELSVIRDGAGQAQPARLAEALGLESQSVTGLLDRMERNGWVRRVRDLPDRRAMRVELLPAGGAVLDDALDALNLALDAILEGVDPREAGAFLDLIGRLGRRAGEGGATLRPT